MRSRGAVAGGLAVLLVLVVGVGFWQRGRLFGPSGPSAESAATAFAGAWQKGSLTTVAWDAPDQAKAAAAFIAVGAGMAATGSDHPAVVRPGAAATSGDTASVPLAVAWKITQDAHWSYSTTLRLHRVAGTWRVVFDPATVAPGLVTGQVLSAAATAPSRADLLGAGRAPLVSQRPVVDLGIEPSRTKDLSATVMRTVAILASVKVTIDGAALLKRAQVASPHAFVGVVTLRAPVYQQVKAQLQPLPGTVFVNGTLPLAPTAGFAQALLGSAGPATAQAIANSNGSIKAGDVVGLSGLQAQFQAQLSGQDGVVVTATTASPSVSTSPGSSAAPSPSSSPTGSAQPDRVLFQVDPKAGAPLQLTLDPTVQQAADTALQAATKPAALVAIQVSTGALLAVANGGPTGAAGYDRALLGRYPPGSTFKIATALALLRQGVTASEPVLCPPSVTISGKKFSNAEHEQFGSVPFATDFAQSCNTAFVGSAGKVSAAQLHTAATDVGYRSFSLGTPSAVAQAPATNDPVGHAAAMIGQGEVLATPLTVAVSAASVAAGRSLTPYLLAGAAPAAGPALDQGRIDVLRQLMRGVVTGGTGTALKSVPGGPVFGKTGTAEYGNAVPPRTHAWFAGYQGDVAFAVLVEDGGFGAQAAAPLVASFLTLLAHH